MTLRTPTFRAATELSVVPASENAYSESAQINPPAGLVTFRRCATYQVSGGSERGENGSCCRNLCGRKRFLEEKLGQAAAEVPNGGNRIHDADCTTCTLVGNVGSEEKRSAWPAKKSLCCIAQTRTQILDAYNFASEPALLFRIVLQYTSEEDSGFFYIWALYEKRKFQPKHSARYLGIPQSLADWVPRSRNPHLS